MIEPADLRKEIQKIRDVALGKSGNKAKGAEMLGQLQNAVMRDLAQTGDQRTRLLLRLMNDFHAELSRAD
jgi:hypothetical protein